MEGVPGFVGGFDFGPIRASGGSSWSCFHPRDILWGDFINPCMRRVCRFLAFFCLQIPFLFHSYPLLSPLLLVKMNLKRKRTGLARPSCERRSERHLQPDSKIKIKMNLKPRWLLARGGGNVYGPICRRFNRMGPALWQEPPVPLPSIWGRGSDFKLFPAVPLFAPLFALEPGQEGRKGGNGDAAGTRWGLWAQVVPTASNSGCALVEIKEPAWKSGLRGYSCGSQGAARPPVRQASPLLLLSQSPSFINNQRYPQ